MKKLALAIGLSAFVAFGTGSSALAAYRVFDTPGFSAIRNYGIAAAAKGANDRLLSLNMAFYPESARVTTGANARLQSLNQALYPEPAPDASGRLCAGDICISAY
jgi:hypothetical protein